MWCVKEYFCEVMWWNFGRISSKMKFLIAQSIVPLESKFCPKEDFGNCPYWLCLCFLLLVENVVVVARITSTEGGANIEWAGTPFYCSFNVGTRFYIYIQITTVRMALVTFNAIYLGTPARGLRIMVDPDTLENRAPLCLVLQLSRRDNTIIPR